MHVDRPPMRMAKPELFKELGYRPHAGQIAVHKSEAPRRVLACGVRWGKTLCAAMEGLAAAMQPADHSVGWVVAPTYDLADRVFRQIVMVALEHMKHRIVLMKDGERRLIIRNIGGGVSEIRAKSADSLVSLLGEGLNWLIIDEAARLKPEIFEGHLSQRLIDKKGWCLIISTPKGKGWFYEAWRRGQGNDPDYASWNCPSWSSPFLDRSLIEVERGRLPERVFRQEYGGEFMEGNGQVFRYVREAATGTFQNPVRDVRYYAGLDLAKVEDYTVLVIINDKCEVVAVDRFNRLDWGQQIGRIKTLTERYNRARTYVDTTGAGEPIYETLVRDRVRVEPYSFTQQSKAAIIDNLALMLEKRQIVLPRPELWPEGVDELEGFQYAVTDHGNVRSSAPSGLHDDCVIALALAAYWVRPSRPRSTITQHPLF